MRKPTQKEIDDFIEYRANHVSLVQKIGEVSLGLNLSEHDYDKITAVGESLELLAMRHSSKKSNSNLSKDDINELRKVSARHAKSQKHHPEYWDSKITVRNFKADDTNIIVATHMPKRYIAEMACDWTACALYHNEPIFKWYNDVIDNTLFLTSNQKEYLKECLEKIAKSVEKYSISFPNRKYDAEQIEFKLEEKISNSDKDQIQKFAKAIRDEGKEFDKTDVTRNMRDPNKASKYIEIPRITEDEGFNGSSSIQSSAPENVVKIGNGSGLIDPSGKLID